MGVSRHNFVLKDGSRWDIDTLTMISNDYNCAFENNFAFSSKSNISRDGQMIKLQDIRSCSNSPNKIIDLFETFITKLDQGSSLKHSLWRHGQRTIGKSVQVAHD